MSDINIDSQDAITVKFYDDGGSAGSGLDSEPGQLDVGVVNVFGDGNELPSSIFTGYRIEKNFTGGADTFTLDLEDDRADQLLRSVAVGMKVVFHKAQSGTPIMIGFIDGFNITPNRDGKRLTIYGRDRLGMLSDASLYPNLGDGTATESFQFKPEDKLETVVKRILGSGPGIKNVIIDDVRGSKIASDGFGIGVKQLGKTGRGLVKNFQSNLSHLLKPQKGESYLAYASRICARAGCQINMKGGTDDTVIVSPPIYERTSQPEFNIYKFVTGPDTSKNNVKNSSMNINYKDQPSVIIAEGNHGGPTWKKVTRKVMCINELTGYQRDINKTLNLNTSLPQVQFSIAELADKEGYHLLKPNQELYDAIPSTIVNLKTFVSRMKYIVDNNSQTEDELRFYVSELMSHYQEQYFALQYEVQGHGQNGHFWAPNLMVHVEDHSFHPTKPISGKFWIKRVELMRSRSGGCTTRLSLSLPYIHIYDITNTK